MRGLHTRVVAFTLEISHNISRLSITVSIIMRFFFDIIIYIIYGMYKYSRFYIHGMFTMFLKYSRLKNNCSNEGDRFSVLHETFLLRKSAVVKL